MMNAKERNYLRGWVSALAAAVWQGDLQSHLARPILLSVGTEAEIFRYADSGDVEALTAKGVLSNVESIHPEPTTKDNDNQ
jgi:queuine/archaeosine tRNA-ribosyltransferase